jgi:hypothetical protein
VNQSVLESDPTSADSLESGSSASARERALYLRVTLRIVPLQALLAHAWGQRPERHRNAD